MKMLGGMAGAEGLELSTSGFGDRRSSQLSYAPIRTSTESAFHTLARLMSSLGGPHGTRLAESFV